MASDQSRAEPRTSTAWALIQAAERVGRPHVLDLQLLCNQFSAKLFDRSSKCTSPKETFNEQAQAESTIPTGTWQSDPIHSHAGFSVKHLVGTFRGSFGEFEASVSDASASHSFRATSPWRASRSRRRTSRATCSPQFFDIEEDAGDLHSQSSAIKVEDGQVVVDGELTVKGVPRQSSPAARSRPDNGPDATRG